MVKMKRWMVLLLMGAAGCKGSDANFLQQAESAPTNYTATSANGTVQKDHVNSDDWRISPQYSGEISINPAYPNPTTTGIVTIPITIVYESATALQFYGESTNGNIVLLLSTPVTIGPYSMRVNLIGLSPSLNLNELKGTLKRIWIYDQGGINGGGIISYGDIQIQ